MTMMERNMLREKCTNSVLSYISSPDGQETVDSYFSRISEEDNLNSAKPNYSNMLEVLGISQGTTRDGVTFGSCYVDRGVVTGVIRELFSVKGR